MLLNINKITLITLLVAAFVTGCSSTPTNNSNSDRKIAGLTPEGPIGMIGNSLRKVFAADKNLAEEDVAKTAAEFFTTNEAKKLGIKFEGDITKIRTIEELENSLKGNEGKDLETLENFVKKNAESFAKVIIRDNEKLETAFVKAIKNPEEAAEAWSHVATREVTVEAAHRPLSSVRPGEAVLIGTSRKEMNAIVEAIVSSSSRIEGSTGHRVINAAGCKQLSKESKNTLRVITENTEKEIDRLPAGQRDEAAVWTAFKKEYQRELVLTDQEAKEGLAALAGGCGRLKPGETPPCPDAVIAAGACKLIGTAAK